MEILLPDVLDWFHTMLRNEYGVTRSPPQRYPSNWRELETRVEATYASASSISYVWRDLISLKRGLMYLYSTPNLQLLHA